MPICSIQEDEEIPIFPNYDGAPNRVQIGSENAHIYVGAKFKINANIIGPESSKGKKIHFSGNNPTIATVDENGVVTGVAAGKMLVAVSIDRELNSYKMLTVQIFPNKVDDMESCVKLGIKPLSFDLSQSQPLTLKTREKEQLYAYDPLPENAWDQSCGKVLMKMLRR